MCNVIRQLSGSKKFGKTENDTKNCNIFNTAQGPLTIAILNNIFFKILLYHVLKFGHCSHKFKGNLFPVQAL